MKLVKDIVLMSTRLYYFASIIACCILFMLGIVHLSGGTMHPDGLVGGLLVVLGIWIGINTVWFGVAEINRSKNESNNNSISS